MTIKNIQVHNTVYFAGIQIRIALIASTILTAYYRLPLPFLALLLCLLYLLWSYSWTLMSCRYTEGESRSGPERMFAGDTVDREFKFTNRWILPLVRCGLDLLLPRQFSVTASAPVLISPEQRNENLAVPSGQIHPDWNRCSVTYAWMSENKEAALRLKVTAPSRGVYYLPPAHLFTGDPSGLYRGMKRLEKEQYWYVFPDLQKDTSLMKALIDEEFRREDSWGIEDRYEYRGVRDYQPADPPQSINWYATARSGNLKTNLYQRKRAERCLVVLDLTAPGYLHQHASTRYVEDPALEQAISLAAGIALSYLEKGSNTAFYTNAPLLRWVRQKSGANNVYQERIRALSTIDFARGNRQSQRILELCAAIDSAGRAFPSEQNRLWSNIAGVPAKTLIYIITYHALPAGMKETAENGNAGNIGDPDPALFYSTGRLAMLSSSRVRLCHLTPDVDGESR